jgi:hypothetical protein
MEKKGNKRLVWWHVWSGNKGNEWTLHANAPEK